ncbi:MAG: polysaccharide biosynthesis tyrosine autokinase [Planctomycetes bacterium]|nr:polysaccharide biosynthesis tyrosine autokinase [Planctomycetota bacterium]
MNNLEKYLDQVIEPKPVVYETPVEAPQPPQPETPTVNLLASVRKRWYLVVVVTLVLSAVALPAVWLLVEPHYLVQGAVKVSPVIEGVLGSYTTPTELGGYSDFVNTEAAMLTSSNPVLQLIADDLAGRNLPFIRGEPQNRIEQLVARVWPMKRNVGPMRILREAIADRTITAGAVPRTQLLAVAMRSTNLEEAKTIVDSFLRNYVAHYASNVVTEDAKKLNHLETQAKESLKSIMDQREQIRALADEFGTVTLAPRQEMEFDVQARLMTELIQLEAQRIAAEANVGLLEKAKKVDLSPEQAVNLRRDYVNSNPLVSELSKSVVAMEQELIVAQQRHQPGYPALVQSQATLEAFNKRLDEQRQKLEQEYDSGMESRLEEAARQRLIAAKMDLERINAHYQALKDRVNQQDVRAQKTGRKNLDIQDRQFKLQVDQEMYDTLARRVKTLQMEQQRSPRVEPAYWADVAETNDRRVQLATAAVIGALACGFGLAFLRDRMDKTLQTPEDVARHLDLPVLGTTTSSRTLKPALFAEQIAGDYQTIRTNLGLSYDGGLPRKLVVSSAGTREGKTTFAVNLATSLAKSGKKVLLIDGDLRKPDVGQMLNVPKDAGYLQEVLLGGDPGGSIYVSPASGLHILAANPRHMADPYELLSSSTAAEQIERLAREYDHVIIDSPPALAFPDALVWARLADAVVLVGYAGQTTAPDLKEARERFVRGRARVLGAVLSNVPVDQSLYRYAYTYRVRGTPAGKAQKSKKLLLASRKPDDGGGAL